jgi:hypothetical protein
MEEDKKKAINIKSSRKARNISYAADLFEVPRTFRMTGFSDFVHRPDSK